MSNRRSRFRSGLSDSTKLTNCLNSLALLLAESPSHISLQIDGFRQNSQYLEDVTLTGSGTTGNVTFRRGPDDDRAASEQIQNILYEAQTAGAAGNGITIEYRAPVVAVAATATLDLTNDIVLTSVATGAARNTTTFTLQVLAAAANPSNTILANFTGTSSAITCTITPNDGTNNSVTPVDLTTAQLRELITTGSVAGKTVTVTDSSSLRALQTATGGGAANLADAGEGDGVVATFSGGVTGHAAQSVTVTGSAIVVYVASGVTTAAQIVSAITGSGPAVALVSATATGTGAETQTSPVAPINLQEGADAATLETYDKADIIEIKRLRNRKWLIVIDTNANPAA